MIIIHLCGGLGQQMYQYAAAKSLSLQTKMPLFYFFRKNKKNPVCIVDFFKIEEKAAKARDLAMLQPITGFLRAILKPMGISTEERLYREMTSFDHAFFEIKSSVFLEGAFKDVRYFRGKEFELHQAFRLKYDAYGREADVLEHIILAQHPVSVHIKAGHPLGDGYFQNAAEEVARKVGNPTFFIFADHPNELIEHLDINYQVEVIDTQKLSNDAELIRLISSCKHHITDADYLSWWAAWLNGRKDKIVIAPKAFIGPAPEGEGLYARNWIVE